MIRSLKAAFKKSEKGNPEVPWTCARDPEWRRKYDEKLSETGSCDLCRTCLHKNKPCCMAGILRHHKLEASRVRLGGRFGIWPNITRYTGSCQGAEASIPKRKSDEYTPILLLWSFMLGERRCDVVVALDVPFSEVFASYPCTAWTTFFQAVLEEELQNEGFEDKAIVGAYSKMHEHTWDWMELDWERENAGFDPGQDPRPEKMTTAFQVVVLARLGDRVKVACHRSRQLLLPSDGAFGKGEDYEVLMYGKPHGEPPLAINIREGKNVSAGDLFMMQLKGEEDGNLGDAAAQHGGGGVEAIALALRKKVAWVVRMVCNIEKRGA